MTNVRLPTDLSACYAEQCGSTSRHKGELADAVITSTSLITQRLPHGVRQPMSGAFFWKNPVNPLPPLTLDGTSPPRSTCFERVTRRYAKPDFGIARTMIAASSTRSCRSRLWTRPFCTLLRFSARTLDGEPVTGRSSC